MSKPKHQYGIDKVRKKRPRPTAKALANLRPAKKGEIRNPEGGRSHNRELKALKNLTVETYRQIIDTVLTGDVKSLRAVAENEDLSAVQVAIAKSLVKAIDSGDYATVERIAERIVGEIPKVVSVNAVTTNMSYTEVALKAALNKLENDV